MSSTVNDAPGFMGGNEAETPEYTEPSQDNTVLGDLSADLGSAADDGASGVIDGLVPDFGLADPMPEEPADSLVPDFGLTDPTPEEPTDDSLVPGFGLADPMPEEPADSWVPDFGLTDPTPEEPVDDAVPNFDFTDAAPEGMTDIVMPDDDVTDAPADWLDDMFNTFGSDADGLEPADTTPDFGGDGIGFVNE